MIWIFWTLIIACPIMAYGLAPILARMDGKPVQSEKILGGALLVVAGIYMTAIFAENAIHPKRDLVSVLEDGK